MMNQAAISMRALAGLVFLLVLPLAACIESTAPSFSAEHSRCAIIAPGPGLLAKSSKPGDWLSLKIDQLPEGDCRLTVRAAPNGEVLGAFRVVLVPIRAGYAVVQAIREPQNDKVYYLLIHGKGEEWQLSGLPPQARLAELARRHGISMTLATGGSLGIQGAPPAPATALAFFSDVAEVESATASGEKFYFGASAQRVFEATMRSNDLGIARAEQEITELERSIEALEREVGEVKKGRSDTERRVDELTRERSAVKKEQEHARKSLEDSSLRPHYNALLKAALDAESAGNASGAMKLYETLAVQGFVAGQALLSRSLLLRNNRSFFDSENAYFWAVIAMRTGFSAELQAFRSVAEKGLAIGSTFSAATRSEVEVQASRWKPTPMPTRELELAKSVGIESPPKLKQIGEIAQKEGYPLVAYSAYSRIAERGDVDAQIQIADMLAFGIGIPQDLLNAIQWYCVAMRQMRAPEDTKAHESVYMKWYAAMKLAGPDSGQRACDRAKEWKPTLTDQKVR